MENSAAPSCTTSPASACRSLTTPSNGARTRVSSSCSCAAASRARASASAPSAFVTSSRAFSRSRSGSAPACVSRSVRWRLRRASDSADSAERTAERDERTPSSMARSSRLARSWPRLTRSPASTNVRSTDPLTSDLTVASCSGSSEPEMVGPLRSSARLAMATFSGPTVTTVSAVSLAVALASSPRLQPARTRAAAMAAGSSCRIMARPLHWIGRWKGCPAPAPGAADRVSSDCCRSGPQAR